MQPDIIENSLFDSIFITFKSKPNESMIIEVRKCLLLWGIEVMVEASGSVSMWMMILQICLFIKTHNF